MQINKNFQEPTFKQIKLSEEELKEAKSYFQKILSEPDNPKHNYDMFDIFESHLNNEVELKDIKTGKGRKNFASNLYIKFFQILESTKKSNNSFESFLDNLNNFSEKFYVKDFFLNDFLGLLDYNVSSAKRAAYHFYKYLDMSKEDFLKMCQGTPVLQHTSQNLLKKDIQKVSNYLGFEEKECFDLYKRNPGAMIRPHTWIIKNADNNMKILNIKDMEEFRNILKGNSEMLTCENLESVITDIAEFLNTSEDNVKKMIKTQPHLATMKFEHIQKNFDSMKEYFNVDRNKMTEIAVIAPITIKDASENNKRKYEEVAKTLKMPVETFIHKGNQLPAIYRTGPAKLYRIVDFLSEKLGYTYEETIDYVAKNLNILSYRYKNIVKNVDENFKVYNEEIGLDYDTYLYLLEENAWIIGHKQDFIRKNIEDYRDYFNIDNEAYAIMLEKNPQIATSFIVNVDKNIVDSSYLLDLDEEDYKEMCVIEPLLMTRQVKFHEQDVPENANILGISEYDFIELGFKNPMLLAVGPDYITEFKNRAEFSKLITENNEIDITNPKINDEETFFEEILSCLVLSALGLATKDKEINLAELISKCKDKFVMLRIPEHELSLKFFDFTNKFLQKNNLENKCKTLIKHL